MALFMASCNSGNETASEGQATEAKNFYADGMITIQANDDMKFDLKEIRVKEGQPIKLTLNHVGKGSKETMGHNFVLLQEGVGVQGFASKAVDAKDNDYIPLNTTEVIAHTRMLGGGESDTIEFIAPSKGTYNFLCSFPGHVGMMKGKFIVE